MFHNFVSRTRILVFQFFKMKRTRFWRDWMMKLFRIVLLKRLNKLKFLKSFNQFDSLSWFNKFELRCIISWHVERLDHNKRCTFIALKLYWFINERVKQMIWISTRFNQFIGLGLFFSQGSHDFICLFPSFNQFLFSFDQLLFLNLYPFLNKLFLLFKWLFCDLFGSEFTIDLVYLLRLSNSNCFL